MSVDLLAVLERPTLANAWQGGPPTMTSIAVSTSPRIKPAQSCPGESRVMSLDTAYRGSPGMEIQAVRCRGVRIELHGRRRSRTLRHGSQGTGHRIPQRDRVHGVAFRPRAGGRASRAARTLIPHQPVPSIRKIAIPESSPTALRQHVGAHRREESNFGRSCQAARNNARTNRGATAGGRPLHGPPLIIHRSTCGGRPTSRPRTSADQLDQRALNPLHPVPQLEERIPPLPFRVSAPASSITTLLSATPRHFRASWAGRSERTVVLMFSALGFWVAIITWIPHARAFWVNRFTAISTCLRVSASETRSAYSSRTTNCHGSRSFGNLKL